MSALLLLAAAAVAAAHPAPPPAAEPAAKPADLPRARLPGFAAVLADQPLPAGPAAWAAVPTRDAWAAVAASAPDGRQEARWALALGHVARGRGADALGVLEVMGADDPDLVLVPGWQRARGAALVLLGRATDALAALHRPMLERDAESCLWRMRAGEGIDARAALAELRCAAPALDARAPAQRRPFVLAAARAALAAGQAAAAQRWLGALADGDAAANLLRARAGLALGQYQPARLLFARANETGSAEERADATLGGVELGLASKTLAPGEARRRLMLLQRHWRGGTVERRALVLATDLSQSLHDDAGVLATGAILFRYFDLGNDTASLAARMADVLARALAPTSRMPLPAAAGLYWEYRDLAPGGAAGVQLAEALTGRLQAAGLYARAADLLQVRLDAAQDVERGPLSVRVGSLRILAGDPLAAIRAVRASDGYPYPAAMQAERARVEAAALDLTGRTAEAVAALEDVPDSVDERAEIYWRAQDWQHLVSVGEPALPAPGRLSDVGQAVVLRHAVGLAMLGREAELGRLRARYAAGFARLPTAPTFAMLTGDPAAVTPAALARAMAALPSASPAGAFGDLLAGGAAAKPGAG